MGKLVLLWCSQRLVPSILIDKLPYFDVIQEDAPLADEGVQEAREAGRLLKLHGFEFDVIYTSWLSRALETAWHVTDEMDALWLPIIKTWRLNERMYGRLTGECCLQERAQAL